MSSGHVVLVTGAAPYLGGPQTWKPLREAAPEFDFMEVDLLECAGHASVVDDARTRISDALSGARAIIAHGTVAAVSIEATAFVNPAMPLLLVSPRMITKNSLALSALRHLFRSRAGSLAITRFAQSKYTKLLSNPTYVRKQLKLLVGENAISAKLLGEACLRIADHRTRKIVDKTAEVLCSALTPLDAGINAAVTKRSVLVGGGKLERKIRAQGHCTVIRGVYSAAMLEAPRAVAEHLRRLLDVK